MDDTLSYFCDMPPDKTFAFGRESRTAAEMAVSLAGLRDFLRSRPPPTQASLRQYITGHFDVFVAPGCGGSSPVLYTGYYTPELAAKDKPDDVYRFPIYAQPDDLLSADLGRFRDRFKGERLAGRVEQGSFVPYYTRAEIDKGALSGRGLELAWCADPVDLFFMQVQGSGILVYPDGRKMHANYRASNGLPYRSIGRMLIERGIATTEEMSLGWLKDYLRSHPAEVSGILNYNESYVFYCLEDTGPYGSLGVPVTPERTIATDMSFFPPGALAYVETEIPVFSGHLQVTGREPYTRFVMNQDTGGAIKGPCRADIYFGSGETAQLRAGCMRQGGRLYFLAGKKFE